MSTKSIITADELRYYAAMSAPQFARLALTLPPLTWAKVAWERVKGCDHVTDLSTESSYIDVARRVYQWHRKALAEFDGDYSAILPPKCAIPATAFKKDKKGGKQ